MKITGQEQFKTNTMDNNYKSIADTSGVRLYGIDLAPDNLDQYSDILKFSNAKDCVIKGSIIWGGKEDCVDMNRNCDGITVDSCHLTTYGQQHMTIKGNTRNVTIASCVFGGEPKNVEIELGNYSEQSDLPPQNITITDCTTASGKPVRVRCLNACPCTVTVVGGNVKVYKPLWVKLGFFSLYCFLRKKNIIK